MSYKEPEDDTAMFLVMYVIVIAAVMYGMVLTQS